jgi:hypothetical protein
MAQIEPAGGQPGAAKSGVAALPALWVGVVILWSAWGLSQAALGTYSYSDLPSSITYLIYAGFTADVVDIVWGLVLVGLAIGRSPSFPRQFIIWQSINIAWVALRTVYVLIIPDFPLSVVPLIYAAVEIGIGVFLIRLLQNNPAAVSAYAHAGVGRPSIIVSIVAALLGIILGGVVGAVVGFGGGALYADLTDMSCFEGACGYFAFFLGLFGIVIGAIAGGILAVWLVNRRRRPATAAAGVSN